MGFEHDRVSSADGLVFWSQSFPPQPGAAHCTSRDLLCWHVELLQAPHGPHALVRQTPCLGALPVQAIVCDEGGLGPVQPLLHGQ